MESGADLNIVLQGLRFAIPHHVLYAVYHDLFRHNLPFEELRYQADVAQGAQLHFAFGSLQASLTSVGTQKNQLLRRLPDLHLYASVTLHGTTQDPHSDAAIRNLSHPGLNLEQCGTKASHILSTPRMQFPHSTKQREQSRVIPFNSGPHHYSCKSNSCSLKDQSSCTS